MDKSTLSNYGWIVIAVLVLSVMIALATPFGNFIVGAVESTTTGLFEVQSNAFEVIGVELPKSEFPKEPASCGIEGHYIGDDKGEHGITTNYSTCKSRHKYTCQCDGWVVPNGGTYHSADIIEGVGEYSGTYTEYTEGQRLVCGYKARQKDKLILGDYMYIYKQVYDFEIGWKNTSNDGWGVRVLDKTKTEYGPMLESVYNKPIFLNSTFGRCTNLTKAPKIPSTVTTLINTFIECKSLTVAPDLSECTQLKNMYYTFYNCSSLTVAPNLSNCTQLTYMEGVFECCSSLITYLGNSDPVGDFSNYVIPSGVTTIICIFSSCKSLTVAPAIPTSVTDMSWAFENCTSLTVAPAIPSSVTNMYRTFDGCTALTGTITINATPTSYYDCLHKTQITEILGDCTIKDKILATK